MALSGVYDAARSGLSVFSQQMGLVARNVDNASDPGASRKIARLAMAATGEALFAGVGRVEQLALREAALTATSNAAASTARLQRVTALESTAGGAGSERTPALLISRLSSALDAFATDPSNGTTGRAVVAAASTLAGALNEWSAAVEKVRDDADRSIAQSVATLNGDLARFAALNDRIVAGTQSGTDVTDEQDERDGLLGAMSEHVGIRAVSRDSGAMALYTDSGITLFETTARTVEFQPVSAPAGMPRAIVIIDGVPATGPETGMAIRSGSIASEIEVRDRIATRYDAQLDELARGLIDAFSEQDQSGGLAPTRPGLFTFAGAATTPVAGRQVVGLAATIDVNATVDPDRGGDWRRIRDGGAAEPGNAAYIYNTDGASAFSERVRALDAALGSQRAFASSTGLETATSIVDLADRSAGWLSGEIADASDRSEQRTAIRDRAVGALGSAVGVSLDQEMANMLVLERSYQASARLITVADSMLQTLLDSVR